MLTQHLKAGNLRRVARGVFAAVPPHAKGARWATDRYLASSRLKPDAVIAYHSALELHGAAYTDMPDVQAVTGGEPTLFETPDFTCRFVKQSKGFNAARDVMTLDRAGLRLNVTTLERTLVDVFNRPDLVGGAEELFNSLALVERVRGAELERQLDGLGNAAASAALGWWLEREQKRLGVSDATLDTIRALRPKHPQYVLGAKPGDATSVRGWNILVPRALATPTFEGS
jgi:predicted transcriptional regulator of viral defense system